MLNDMTMPQLNKLARKLDMKVKFGCNKADLVRAIRTFARKNDLDLPDDISPEERQSTRRNTTNTTNTTKPKTKTKTKTKTTRRKSATQKKPGTRRRPSESDGGIDPGSIASRLFDGYDLGVRAAKEVLSTGLGLKDLASYPKNIAREMRLQGNLRDDFLKGWSDTVKKHLNLD